MSCLTRDGRRVSSHEWSTRFFIHQDQNKTSISERTDDWWWWWCVCVQGAMACCKKKDRKTVSDEECSEMDAEPSSTEEEAPGPLNITDEMKRMLNQLYETPPAHTRTHTHWTLPHQMNINKMYSPTHFATLPWLSLNTPSSPSCAYDKNYNWQHCWFSISTF